MNTIQVQLNGQPASFPEASTVRDVIAAHTGKMITDQGRAADGTRLGVAIAVDGDVVPRSAWARRALAAEARIDLVTAAQGG